MRCAVFWPTPGSTRNASINCSSKGADTAACFHGVDQARRLQVPWHPLARVPRRKSERQLHARRKLHTGGGRTPLRPRLGIHLVPGGGEGGGGQGFPHSPARGPAPA